MFTRCNVLLATTVFLLAACGGNGGDETPDGGVDPGYDAGTDGGTDGGSDAGTDGGQTSTACQDLLDAQPVIEGRAKSVITSMVTTGGCDAGVELQFKDSNGNGALDPYENWTLTVPERVADLVGRMDRDHKVGLMAHATVTDAPDFNAEEVSAAVQGLIGEGLRFGKITTRAGHLESRARWANSVQELAEAGPYGIPFVLSSEPAHYDVGGREKGAAFSQWPSELGLAATDDAGIVQRNGEIVSQEFRALGIRMALAPSADLATDPRWHGTQFSFGENPARVAALVSAFVAGLQGETLGPDGVAAVVGRFPGAGAASGGYDGRLEKGKYLAYPGDNVDQHLEPFEAAFSAGAAGVMPAHGIPQAGPWTGLDGLLDGSTIEQVGASFNQTLLTDVLRDHYGFGGLVVSPWGILDEPGPTALGAPWGVESMSPSERVAEAVQAGVDQFGGLDDLTPILEAANGGLVTGQQIDAAAGRALAPVFGMGLFENPYVTPIDALRLINSDTSYRAGLNAMNKSMVLLHNADKPSGWLNGDGDGTQTGDKANAGNGSGKVLPAPPGEPYVAAGCSYYILGDFDLDYVRSVSAGYGELTNDLPNMTPEERIAYSHYVFMRIPAPCAEDPDSGRLSHCQSSLEYAGSGDTSALEDLAFARSAIDAAGSNTQIIVGVDAGRPSVMSEIMSYGVSGLYVDWGVSDKVFLDVAFGIVDGSGTLPVGLPESDAAAEGQLEDLPHDGQSATFVEGHGIATEAF